VTPVAYSIFDDLGALVTRRKAVPAPHEVSAQPKPLHDESV